MPLRPESWAVIGTAVVGITAAVMAFLKTPPEKRGRLRAPTIEERLAACPPEEGARIVRGDWRRALRRDLPWLIVFLPLAALSSWLTSTEGQECATLFGVGRFRLMVVGFLGVVPVLLMSSSLQVAYHAVLSLRTGYWPPLAWAQYRDTIARAGRAARYRAVAVLVFFALTVAMTVYAYAQFLSAFDGKLWLRVASTEAACPATP